MTRIAFVLAATSHGTMIINRFDMKQVTPDSGFGVGFSLLESGKYETDELMFMLHVLKRHRELYGDGVVAMDIGANIGVHTIPMAGYMDDWGQVIAVEPQERIFHALCGNVAINNCFNVFPVHAAMGRELGDIHVPILDYCKMSSFGSLELHECTWNEDIGQSVDYKNTYTVPLHTVDFYNQSRLDLLKIDVEGMELDVINGAIETIERCHPVLLIEHTKIDKNVLETFLSKNGYSWREIGINLLCVHESDKTFTTGLT